MLLSARSEVYKAHEAILCKGNNESAEADGMKASKAYM